MMILQQQPGENRRSRAALLGYLVLGSVLTFRPQPAAAATLSAAAAADFDLSTVRAGLAEPTDMVVLPDGRLIITERLGDVFIISPDETEVKAHITVKPVNGEQGLLGVVADPNFAQNQFLYFYASAGDAAADKHKVLKGKLNAAGVLGTLEAIVDKGLAGPSNHNGGALEIFGNQLYIAVGDTGHNDNLAGGVPKNRFATCLNVPNGKILRVNLDGSIPTDNPLSALTEVTGCDTFDGDLGLEAPDKRIYAWGLRNAFRFWIDPTTSNFWIGDVGEGAFEELSVAKGPNHYGYPFFEGNKEYSQAWKPANACMGITPATACTPPVYQYAHDGVNNCIIGGRILDGCGWPAVWRSRYIFGDNGSGKVWTLDVKPDRSGVVDGSVKDFMTTRGMGSFRFGSDNALYVAETTNGAVLRVTAKGAPTSCGTTNGAGGTGGSNGAGGIGGSTSAGGAGGSTSAGGVGGSTSTGGASGDSAEGGAPADGEAGAPVTTPSGGKNAGASGGAASSGNGGTSASGGTGGDATPAPGGSEGDDGGCGCRTAAGKADGWGLAAASLGLVGLWLRRKRQAGR